MAKVASIDFAERMVDRGAEEALNELRAATLDFIECMEELGRPYPGAVAIGHIAFGTPSAMVLSVSTDDGVQIAHRLPDALDRAKLLANCIAYLPADLLREFELQLAITKASREPAQVTSASEPDSTGQGAASSGTTPP
jgi:hypothetical protein